MHNFAPSTYAANLRYVLYARKSSESEDRQVQSIDDQTRIMREMAAMRGFTIVEEVTESHSAKDPGKRPGFERMMALIESGRADAVLCWHVNRLSRNPIDAGRLAWLLQTEKLRAIQTNDRTFLPSDNVLLFSIESGVATQENLTMTKNVRRGTESKLAKGWAPYRAPEGYRNNLYDHTIEPDGERFDLVKRAWHLLVSGTHTVSGVWRVMNEDWGYKTRPTHNGGNKTLARTTAYKMFTNVFYAGYFPYNGEVYPASHTPMITLSEFEAAQKHIRGQVNKPHRHKHDFAYAGLMICGTCGKGVTAEMQAGRHGRGNYVYYHCGNRGCTNRKNVREEVIEEQIAKALVDITIITEFRVVVLDALEGWLIQESGGLETVSSQQSQSLSKTERMISELLELRLQGVIDDDLFRVKQVELKEKVSRLRLSVAGSRERLDRTRQSVTNALSFRESAWSRFVSGDTSVRREIAKALGTRFILAGETLSIEVNPLLDFMQSKQEQADMVQAWEQEKASVQSPVSTGYNLQNMHFNRLDLRVSEPRKIGSGRTKKTLAGARVRHGWTDRTETENYLTTLFDAFTLASHSDALFCWGYLEESLMLGLSQDQND